MWQKQYLRYRDRAINHFDRRRNRRIDFVGAEPAVWPWPWFISRLLLTTLATIVSCARMAERMELTFERRRHPACPVLCLERFGPSKTGAVLREGDLPKCFSASSNQMQPSQVTIDTGHIQLHIHHRNRHYHHLHRVSKNSAKLFLSELLQISTSFDNFWQKHGKEAKIMRGVLIFHLS